jgi:eukaryotic-like serine/threonine-protein kinase
VSSVKVCPQCGTEYPANARFCEIDGTALRSTGGQQDLVGSVVAERYHVMKKLGEGGMGQVYLAEHVKMGRKSALKVMHPGMVKDVDAISRFNREASNASRISHPNVAAVYDFGETPDGLIFLAMEFVDGPPLTKVIEQAGALPAKRAAEIVRQTGDALAVAHDLGIVHRDLKPDNIMIAKTRDGGDLVKVVDFGIAKAGNSAAQKVTKTGLVVGTPEYMSPEQLAGGNLDGRSDIYSLALVAFNMLTGTLPFPADSAQESMIMRLTDRPRTLSEMRPDIAWPADVQAVLDKALERDVATRYHTASEFGRDLQRTIDRMPESKASEMRTQMIDVPPTRVRPEDPPRTSVSPGVPAVSAGGTIAVPSPGADSFAPVTQAAAPRRKMFNVAVVAGAAGVIVLGAFAVKTFVGGSANAVASVDTLKKTSPETTTSAPISGVPSQAGSSTASVDSQVSPPATGGSTTPHPGAAKTSVADQLSALINDAADSSKAKSVLDRLAKLERPAANSRELYLAASIRSNVWAAKGTKADTVKACQALQKVYARLDSTEKSQADQRINITLSCLY